MTVHDAIIVGAGPAGASAAYHLARLGRRVLLLDRARFPRDKSCGDGLTRFATRQLAEMGVLEMISGAALSQGVRVHMRGHGSRDFRYPDDPDPSHQGIVVPRFILDHAICQRAVAVGAELWEEVHATALLHDAAGAVCGVVVERRDGHLTELHARVVIAADGASSRLARQAGLRNNGRDETGYAIRGYYDGIEGLGDLLEIHMPLRDPTDRYLLPSYGWVFPTGPTSANIGVGLVQRERGSNVREMMGRFLEELRHDAPRFAAMRPCGEWRGAALRFDFVPQHCTSPGLVLAGDAAGLVSPFTGEGISYALASGRLAAETIDRALAAPGTLDLADYPRALAGQYTGYFEAGRESALRYRLIWRLVESTFQSDRPLYDICRRAALFPEGIGESYIREAFTDVGQTLGQGTEAEPDGPAAKLAGVRADLMGVGEMLLGTVRQNWPFLARVVTVEESVPGVPLRPALLLLLAGRAAGQRPPAAVPLAAAVEMGFIAALAHTSVTEERASSAPDRANWGNRAALMVGDFLLASAYAVSAEISAEASGMIAAAAARAAEGHLRSLRHAHDVNLTLDEHRAILDAKAGTLFELPCRLGGRAAGASPRIVAALGTYGRKLGVAYQIRHDLSAAQGQATELGRAVGSNLAEGIYPLAVVHALHSDYRQQLVPALAAMRVGGSATEVAGIVLAAGGEILAASDAARTVADAKAALRNIPDGTLRVWLERLADSLLVSG